MAPEKTDISDGTASPTAAGTTTTADTVVTSPTADSGNSAADVSTVSIDSTNGEHDPYFEPVVTLPEVTIKTLEEDENEIYKGRCKMFRFVHNKEEGSEWKERGTGNVKLLKHEEKGTVRLLMRQEKTLKVRANHYITPYMKLRPNCGSDRAFVWYVMFDFADEETKGEMFAIKFANADNARVFKDSFEDAVTYVTSTIVADCQELAETLATVRQEGLEEEEEEEEEDLVEGVHGETTREKEPVPEPTKETDVKQSANTDETDVAESLGQLTVEESTTSKSEQS